MSQEITLTFNPKTGECLIDAKGFKGSSCIEATNFLSATLGEMKDFKKKKEYFEVNIKATGGVHTNYCG